MSRIERLRVPLVELPTGDWVHLQVILIDSPSGGEQEDDPKTFLITGSKKSALPSEGGF
jgi:hypothetical protein